MLWYDKNLCFNKMLENIMKWSKEQKSKFRSLVKRFGLWFMVYNATFNNL